MTTKPQLILASASPRRKALLSNVGCEFEVKVADVDESVLTGESPAEYVGRVARAKAHKVHGLFPNSAILSADTTVACHGEIFGKPSHREHAFDMWQTLSARDHEVITGVCLLFGELEKHAVVSTTVHFSKVSTVAMQQYWQSGEPQDKAGGYAIQGLASAWVEKVAGSYSNVVGLPLFETNDLLRSVGHNWL